MLGSQAGVGPCGRTRQFQATQVCLHFVATQHVHVKNSLAWLNSVCRAHQCSCSHDCCSSAVVSKDSSTAVQHPQRCVREEVVHLPAALQPARHGSKCREQGGTGWARLVQAH